MEKELELEFWCYRCGLPMLFRRAIGFYPLDAPFKDDYDMEELWICTNINCKTQYVFFDLYYTIPDDRGFFVND